MEQCIAEFDIADKNKEYLLFQIVNGKPTSFDTLNNSLCTRPDTKFIEDAVDMTLDSTNANN